MGQLLTKPTNDKAEQEKLEKGNYQKQDVMPASYDAIRNAIGSITPKEAEEMKCGREEDWERSDT